MSTRPIVLESAYGKVEIDTSGVVRSQHAFRMAMGAMSRDLNLAARDIKNMESELKGAGIAISAMSATGGALITTSAMTAARTEERSSIRRRASWRRWTP